VSLQVEICYEKWYPNLLERQDDPTCQPGMFMIYRTMRMSAGAANLMLQMTYPGGRAWNEPGHPPVWIELS
jgi:hypothetical protein